MTKLMEWLTVLVVLLSAYLAIVTRQIQSKLLDDWMLQITVLPIVAIGLFGVYSIFIVLYRVFTFNDCPDAAEEIQRQIKEAKADLKSKGLKL